MMASSGSGVIWSCGTCAWAAIPTIPKRRELKGIRRDQLVRKIMGSEDSNVGNQSEKANGAKISLRPIARYGALVALNHGRCSRRRLCRRCRLVAVRVDCDHVVEPCYQAARIIQIAQTGN